MYVLPKIKQGKKYKKKTERMCCHDVLRFFPLPFAIFAFYSEIHLLGQFENLLKNYEILNEQKAQTMT